MVRYLGIAFAAAGRPLLGGPPHLALLFTASCWWFVLVAFGLIGIVVAIRIRGWRARIVTSILLTLVTWQVGDALKNVFHRQRPTTGDQRRRRQTYAGKSFGRSA